jgi:heme/copper-type cytochrome/quinol oxidase subunit 2
MIVNKDRVLRWVLTVRWLGFLVPGAAFGQTGLTMPASPVQDVNDVVTAACAFAAFMFFLALAIGIIFVLVAAFKYLTSGGDASKVSEAHHAVTYAAIGFAVAIIANGVPAVVSSILGGSTIQACV